MISTKTIKEQMYAELNCTQKILTEGHWTPCISTHLHTHTHTIIRCAHREKKENAFDKRV